MSRAIKFRVNTFPRDQVRATALFYDPSVVEHDDLIEVVNGGQPMRCDQSCPAAHQFFDCLHDRRFGGWIERRSWFVKQQDGSIFQKCSRDPYALPLTDAQMSTPLTDEAAVPLGHL